MGCGVSCFRGKIQFGCNVYLTQTCMGKGKAWYVWGGGEEGNQWPGIINSTRSESATLFAAPEVISEGTVDECYSEAHNVKTTRLLSGKHLLQLSGPRSLGGMRGESPRPDHATQFYLLSCLVSPRTAFKVPGAPSFTVSWGSSLFTHLQGVWTRPSKGKPCCCLVKDGWTDLGFCSGPVWALATCRGSKRERLRELAKLIQGSEGWQCSILGCVCYLCQARGDLRD